MFLLTSFNALIFIKQQQFPFPQTYHSVIILDEVFYGGNGMVQIAPQVFRKYFKEIANGCQRVGEFLEGSVQVCQSRAQTGCQKAPV